MLHIVLLTLDRLDGLQTEGESKPLNFSQTFHLMPVGSSFVVTNDMFRLNYG